ncbi:hypothetical protein Sjap_008302 [Stephania japonica]|uniref:Uncharacterized protein n=1 Tax=Stephania japonica TaxID=461633 RepID=A0AAP0PAR5_9MAGN
MVASVLGGLVIVPGCWVSSALGNIASALSDSSPKKETCFPNVPSALVFITQRIGIQHTQIRYTSRVLLSESSQLSGHFLCNKQRSVKSERDLIRLDEEVADLSCLIKENRLTLLRLIRKKSERPKISLGNMRNDTVKSFYQFHKKLQRNMMEYAKLYDEELLPISHETITKHDGNALLKRAKLDSNEFLPMSHQTIAKLDGNEFLPISNRLNLNAGSTTTRGQGDSCGLSRDLVTNEVRLGSTTTGGKETLADYL